MVPIRSIVPSKHLLQLRPCCERHLDGPARTAAYIILDAVAAGLRSNDSLPWSLPLDSILRVVSGAVVHPCCERHLDGPARTAAYMILDAVAAGLRSSDSLPWSLPLDLIPPVVSGAVVHNNRRLHLDMVRNSTLVSREAGDVLVHGFRFLTTRVP